jgi:hypothetical protein
MLLQILIRRYDLIDKGIDVGLPFWVVLKFEEEKLLIQVLKKCYRILCSLKKDKTR